jgi:hypothetical protein
MSTWYRTGDFIDWKNQTGGIETSVANARNNASKFTTNHDYYASYWYKK